MELNTTLLALHHADALVAQFDVQRTSHDLQILSGEAFAGRRIGTAGHDAAQAWLFQRLSDLGLETSLFTFTLDKPVLDLFAVPTLTTQACDNDVLRTFRHRTEFTPHPRSAASSVLVTGVARRFDLAMSPDSHQSKRTTSAGAWLILDTVPQGDELTIFAAERALEGTVGLLLPQWPNAEGYLVKRITAGQPIALPTLSVRADLLPSLDGQRVTASAPIRSILPTGAHALGLLPGADATLALAPLILSAHYDGVGDDGPPGAGGDRLPCATDNAAGVAVVLEVARVFAAHAQARRPQRPIIFAALDAEEVNALGSQAYAAALHAQGMTPLALNLDGAAVVHEAIYVEAGRGADLLLTTLDQAGERLELPLTTGPISSDNRRFAAAGFPAVGLSVGLSGLHTPADTVDRVNPEAMRRAGALLLATIWRLAFASDEPFESSEL